MAFSAGYKARILNGDFELSTKLSSISVPVTVEQLETTTFADNGVKTFVPGLVDSTFTCEGFIDAATMTDAAAWTTQQPFVWSPKGFTLGNPVVMLNSIKSNFETGSQVGGVSSFTLDGQTTGPADFGYSLHDLTAETADGDGTAVDGGAASSIGGFAQLHVTAYSGLTSAVVIVEDSADNVSFATIATFTTVTAVTSERVAVSGAVRRYVRYSLNVTGTGSVTFACFFARH